MQLSQIKQAADGYCSTPRPLHVINSDLSRTTELHLFMITYQDKSVFMLPNTVYDATEYIAMSDKIEEEGRVRWVG